MSIAVNAKESARILEQIKSGQESVDLRGTSPVDSQNLMNVVFDFEGKILLCQRNCSSGEFLEQSLMWLEESEVDNFV